MSFTLPPVITDEGAAFLATIIAGQGTINFNSVKYSSTDYTASPQTLTKDNFAGVFATDSTPSASAASPSTISISTAITNSGIAADTSLYSIGVIADDGNGNSALVCVCVTDTPDVISEDTGATSTYAYNINLGVSSTENITVTGSVAGALYVTDIVDNLTSSATNKALSANQGKALSDAKQNKALSAAITIGGVSQTTVEGALGGLNAYADKIKNNISNRNLLLNSWFTVNQRGVTSGTFSTANNIDMWKNTAGVESTGTWTLGSSGVAVDATNVSGNCYFTQAYENNLDATKIYTASIMLGDGTIISKTGTLSIIDEDEDAVGFTAYNYRFQWYVKPGKTATIRAVKLELGSVSTLHLDVAPNYTEELLKCQWYFERVKLLGVANSRSPIGFGVATSATNLRGIIFTAQKRTIPSVTSSGNITIYGNTEQTATAISVEEYSSHGVIVNLTSTGLTSGALYAITLNNASYYIDFNSELN